MATTTANRFALDTATLSGVHWLAMALAAITGVIHLVLGVSFAPEPLGISFLLAGIGFFAGIALVLVDYRRMLVYVAGVAFTAVQVPLWYWLNYVGTGQTLAEVGTIEVVDKVAQLVLIVLLFVLISREE
ncbi:DUF7475 family protein [Halomarina ordinaria]|uniref:Uncharacterized protein n=1 Tax=Halomarina ordinaria TaxID=3033939 RepID=A0ABD5U7Z4_9EURY|nr:hypothetical protein [Halomarina sp. PSRA2]